MFIKPSIITYEREEIALGKNKLHFQRGPNRIIWELDAEKVLVYIFSNVVQVIGEWYKKDCLEKVTGVLNLRLSDEEMAKAKFGNLTASEITALEWSDWFIYRVNKKEDMNGYHSFDYYTAR